MLNGEGIYLFGDRGQLAIGSFLLFQRIRDAEGVCLAAPGHFLEKQLRFLLSAGRIALESREKWPFGSKNYANFRLKTG